MKKILIGIVLLVTTASSVKAQYIMPDQKMTEEQINHFCKFRKKYGEQEDKVNWYLNSLKDLQYETNDRKQRDFIDEEIKSVREGRFDEDGFTVRLVEAKVNLWVSICKAQEVFKK